VQTPGPFYVRLGRPKVPTIENKGSFNLGKAQFLTEGKDVTIIACGIMVQEALFAVANLAKQGIKARLINMHTIKPLDKEAILSAARETRGIVVCEEHSIVGGLASGVDEIVVENYPTKVIRLGVKNRYGQSGEPAELLKEYDLTSIDIEKAVSTIIS
jgi:transketolase